MIDDKLSLKYILVIVLVVFFTWISHEFVHWLTSELLGHKAAMGLNKVYPLNRVGVSKNNQVLISASGPILTLLQGLLAFFMLKKGNWNKYFYTLLFVAFYMRLLAGVMNIIKPNDEGRISVFLNLGTFTLPIIISGLLFLMVYFTSKQYRLEKRFQGLTTLCVMVVSSFIILVDQYFNIRIL